jgi:hypothetical protein
MKYHLLRALFWAWFKTRGYYFWSKLWRAVLERDYRKQELTQYAHIEQLEEHLSKMTWVSDPLGGVFDVISSPQKVEAVLRKKLMGESEVAHVGDCDEFAQYAADRIQEMVDAGKTKLQSPRFVSVNWLDKDGGFHGHNICVFYNPADKRWGHIGNWFGGKAQYGFQGLDEIAEWFATKSSRDGVGRLIGYAAATSTLKLDTLELG